MAKKKLLKIGVCLFLLVMIVYTIFGFNPIKPGNMTLSFDVEMNDEEGNSIQIYYASEKEGFSEANSKVYGMNEKEISFPISAETKKLRVDFGKIPENIVISNMKMSMRATSVSWTEQNWDSCIELNDIEEYKVSGENCEIKVNGEDPYMVWEMDSLDFTEKFEQSCRNINLFVKGITVIALIVILVSWLKRFALFVEFPAEIWKSKKQLLQLAKNDFKTKYAGSYLGIVWAFVQPIVTVLVYWFVFEKGLKSGAVLDVPFVLWLIAGLVPWFFFSDALNGGTNALIDYQYLVKKVVFQINILPLVKVVSAFFVHLFFLLFTLILFAGYGYFPDLYVLQIAYYSLCAFVLVLGISYATSALVGFFRDLTQIIGIVLQVGVWMTPIMWNIDTMGLPEGLKIVFKANPMYYIVSGYRDALINKVWFWENAGATMYFWIFTICVLGLGTIIFKKLKPHFADVL